MSLYQTLGLTVVLCAAASAIFAAIAVTGGLRRYFDILVNLIRQGWQLLTLGYNRDKLHQCKIYHEVAASETDIYGSIQSVSIVQHVQTCPLFREIYSPVRKTPIPPKGNAGVSRAKCSRHIWSRETTLDGSSFVYCTDCGTQAGHVPSPVQADATRLEN